jgi:hypothetical protein
MRTHAKDVLVFTQARYQHSYNEWWIAREFEVRDSVLLNSHLLKLFGSQTGVGKKLLKRHNGPFEIIGKLSTVTYCLHLPSSYWLHPILSIAHLKPYQPSLTKFGPGMTIPFERAQAAT